MTTLRWILLLPFLLMQVWPSGLDEVIEKSPPKCEMDCCGWLVEAGLAEDCHCAVDSGEPTRPSPAAPKGGAGDFKPAQPGCILAAEHFQPSGLRSGETPGRVRTRGALFRPHVRLTVLFGAFLI
jgi:hypothetical protein